MDETAVALTAAAVAAAVAVAAVACLAYVTTIWRRLLRESRIVVVRYPTRMTLSPWPSEDQGWYWTPEWQAMEAEADEDIAAGRTVGPMDDSEFDTWLDRLDAEAEANARARAA